MSIAPDDPRHGTTAGTAAHRKAGEKPCGPCADADYRKSKATKLRLLQGVRHRVPLGDAAWQKLEDAGLTEIHKRTGISRNMLWRLRDGGPRTVVLLSTRERILSARSPVTAIGVQRRLQALSAFGYSMQTVADTTGMNVDTIKRIRARTPIQFVCTDQKRAIVKFYAEHHMTPPPENRSTTHTRRLAERRGWAVPFAWDNIDDPAEIPKGTGYVEPSRAEVIREMYEDGEGISAVLRRLGVRREALERWCLRHGMNEELSAMIRRETVPFEQAYRNQFTGGAA